MVHPPPPPTNHLGKRKANHFCLFQFKLKITSLKDNIPLISRAVDLRHRMAAIAGNDASSSSSTERVSGVSFSTGNESDRSTRRPVEDRLKILTRPTRYNKRLPEITEIVLKSLSVRCSAILGEVKSIAPHHCCVIWVHQSRLRIAMLNQNPLKIGWDFYQTTWRHTPKQFTQSKCVAA